jgi:hypothetical protein
MAPDRVARTARAQATPHASHRVRGPGPAAPARINPDRDATERLV